MRRTLAAAALAAVASLAVAADAGAAPPRGQWTDPAATRLEEAGPYLFRGTASDPDGVGIDRVELIVVGDEDDARCRPLVDPGRPNPQPFPGNEGSGSVEFQWVVSFPCNGTYDLVARATSQASTFQGPETADIVRQHQIAAPPAPVADFQARYVAAADDPVDGGADAPADDPVEGSDAAIELSWAANGEADLLEYEIARGTPGGELRAWAIVPADQTSVYDHDIEPGTEYRYAIFAVRGRPERGVDPVVSEASTDDARVPGRPASTTTTSGDGDGGGGSGDGGGGDASRSAGTVDRAGFDDLRQRPRPRVTAPRTVTTIDTGFGETLPFDPSRPDEAGDEVAASEPVGDAAVVAELTDDEADQRALLLPLAGALALLVGFLQVRYLLRRVDTPG